VAGFEGHDGCGGGAVFLGDIVVLLLEVEGHRGECGAVYGIG
jgi:hypothetical protein